MPAVVNVLVVLGDDSGGRSQAEGYRLGEELQGDPSGGSQDGSLEPNVGSGIVVDAARGLIVTNAHVVEGAAEILVVLKDRRQFKAQLLGSDAGTNVAVLRIHARRLTAIQFGRSQDLEIGDFVIAIGNAFGLGQSATLGIVSALGQSVNANDYEDFIQTDAQISPGDSGGALIGLDGRLLGMNTAIIVPVVGQSGLGFAIPADVLKRIVPVLAKHGRVHRGRLGLHMQDVTPSLADALALGVDYGALVIAVDGGSTAEAAGIRVGDVVVAANGKAIDAVAPLRNAAALLEVGETLRLTLRRSREALVTSVTIGAIGEAGPNQVAFKQVPGVWFRDADTAMQTPPGRGAARVVAVERGTEAWVRGLRANNVVTAVNLRPVTSAAELGAALRSARENIALRVLRALPTGEEEMYVVIR